MHVSRSGNGDGTLLTSIWDSKAGQVNLFFYHAYDSSIRFNIQEELSKGNHTFSLPEIFPPNPQYERLVSYKTPFNTPGLRLVLVTLGALLLLIPLVLGGSFWKKRRPTASWKPVLSIAAINLLLTAYLGVLATNIYVYYFDAPYKHHSSNLVSVSSYTPFLLLIAFIPITLFTINQLKSSTSKTWIKAMLVSNNFIYLLLLIGFSYWGLYSFWL